ncbi:hypothetical protein AVEN_215633-1 [Araneus ventricosus]|uniref:Uncharacterized protein n=1 Tax=Araneus ventricosus TaxID=182803 RepID=A0A4Y2QB37_ARAVE|nr:hypothetical protein AVEN_215633-1 [Araneus ventricosus]
MWTAGRPSIRGGPHPLGQHGRRPLVAGDSPAKPHSGLILCRQRYLKISSPLVLPLTHRGGGSGAADVTSLMLVQPDSVCWTGSSRLQTDGQESLCLCVRQSISCWVGTDLSLC